MNSSASSTTITPLPHIAPPRQNVLIDRKTAQVGRCVATQTTQLRQCTGPLPLLPPPPRALIVFFQLVSSSIHPPLSPLLPACPPPPCQSSWYHRLRRWPTLGFEEKRKERKYKHTNIRQKKARARTSLHHSCTPRSSPGSQTHTPLFPPLHLPLYLRDQSTATEAGPGWVVGAGKGKGPTDALLRSE